jgi:prepilin-type N-terminal cleavage/methylation domain-containing protein
MFGFWFKNNNRKQKGFTLVETLLALVVTGAIFTIVAQSMIQQTETYSFITNRKSTIGDVRRALRDMNYELLRIQDGDIQDIAEDSIDFVDAEGNNSSYEIGLFNNKLSITKGGNDVLLPGISSFEIEYEDGMGNSLDPAVSSVEDVVRIKFIITTQPKNDEPPITLSTTVIPRDFIGYSNYQ